jgi:hypothetical protein
MKNHPRAPDAETDPRVIVRLALLPESVREVGQRLGTVFTGIAAHRLVEYGGSPDEGDGTGGFIPLDLMRAAQDSAAGLPS